MGKLLWLCAATLGMLALSGVPAHDPAAPLLRAAWNAAHAGNATSAEGALPLAPDARWSESGSLLLLGTGFFAAAVLVRRRHAGGGRL